MLRRDWKANDTFMVYSPTGSGKTGLAAFIVAGFVSRGMRVLFCVPYTILIGQTANRFVQYGLPGDEIGYIWADHPNYDPDRKIQIASADTLIRRVFPENIDLLIIDEAQNTTPNQIKGIITRAGKGTKIVLLGDPFQIDRPFLDERTNGLSYASEHMKGSRFCCQITMLPEECERSELATDAIERL